MTSGLTADHSQRASKAVIACGTGREDPLPTVNVPGLNSSHELHPCGSISLMAVASALKVRVNPASDGRNDWPAAVLASVTRKMRAPNVGSVSTVLAAPSAGAAGGTRTSVPV